MWKAERVLRAVFFGVFFLIVGMAIRDTLSASASHGLMLALSLICLAIGFAAAYLKEVREESEPDLS